MDKFSTRRSFGKNVDQIIGSNFVGVQKFSYEEFLQYNIAPENREDKGLQKLFKDIFDMQDEKLKFNIEFLSYAILPPTFNEQECVNKSRTYAADLKIKFRFTTYENKHLKIVKESKDLEVFFGQIPLMCQDGSFIINGVYRTIISQLHKSPGIFFIVENLLNQSYKKHYYAKIIPNRGIWLDIEIDPKDVCWVRLDKRKKMLLSSFLMLFDSKNEKPHDILSIFYDKISYKKYEFGWLLDFNEKYLKSSRFVFDILHPTTGEILLPAGKVVSNNKLKELKALEKFGVKSDTILSYYIAGEVTEEGETFISGSQIDEKLYNILMKRNEITLFNIDNEKVSSCLRDTFFLDKIKSKQEALMLFYKMVKYNEIYNQEEAATLFDRYFYNSDRFDLSDVGRVRLNSRLKQFYENDFSTDALCLTKEDIVAIVKGLLHLKNTNGVSDNIDNLSSRRVRSVGELVMNQCRSAFYKIVKNVKERLSAAEADETIDFFEVFNTKIFALSIKEFFGTSELSQMMDNLNPLSKLAHDRRITVMGKGGVSISRVSEGMRDIGPSYYGKICPIESPDGQKIGLISYLSSFANIDPYGFIRTPYRKVVNGHITDEIEYLNAQIEELYNIASYNVVIDENNNIVDKEVMCRYAGEDRKVPVNQVQYIDVSSRQILSVAASLIPFINHIDPGRAMMGSNMQRQALPLKFAQAPFVGTGIEKQIGIDSMNCIVAKHKGKVVQLDSSKIVIQNLDNFFLSTTYELKKFQRSNACSCINQFPIVNLGDIVEEGQVIADGNNTDKGEISLGKNLRVAFMTYKGLTFEDSIVISDRLLKDTLTSVKIEELNVLIKKGESFTRSVPNVSEESLRNLDESGIVCVGAKVKPGDVLVGRVAIKLDTNVTPEERLLRAMFGEKANNVADISLKVPAGIAGTVIDVQILSKQGYEKDERTLLNERFEIQKLEKNREIELRNIKRYYNNILTNLLFDFLKENDVTYKKALLDKKNVNTISCEEINALDIHAADKKQMLLNLKIEFETAIKKVNDKFYELSQKIIAGDDLPNSVNKQIKIFIAVNRVIEAGDKLSGRYGNKGIVARVIPVANMPYDASGKPVDIILNPLGIAARLNIGQIFEVHLGWVSNEIGNQVTKLLGEIAKTENFDKLRKLLQKIYPKNKEIENFTNNQLIDTAIEISSGLNFSVPSFDGPSIEEIKNLLTEWGMPEGGKIALRDGETGELYDNPVTVGYMYIMKLNHMVADKIHSRSTGNYSLITQQPPGGRAKMGGQRKGEMEIWALQAYGAAYLTKESMTIKSDDHIGRVAAYESMVRGEEVVNSDNIPEGFKVLIQELNAVLLHAECLIKKTDEEGKTYYLPNSKGSDFDVFKLSIMSPKKVRELSYGEVKNSQTINYRTRKAEIGGLHCPTIFGPEKNYQCHCQRYNKVKFRGIICEKCGVEVTVSRVRRERMGHIELAAPVAHIWFTKILPSSIGTILDVSIKNLEKILRFELYVVTKPGVTPMNVGELLTASEFEQAKSKYGSTSFTALIGAAGIEALLENINLENEKENILISLSTETNEFVRKKLIKKLKMIQSFINNHARPEWMIIRTLPVLPADLRPLVAIEGGRFATADINDLYRRVINRNNRLKALNELNFPTIVKQNEERMIATAVNSVIDNSRLDQPFTASNGRVLQSIGDVLKGKQGRFRQNLLGKRVDYSGRSVIVVGPHLKLHQCGLPRMMALELFKPFVYARLEQYGYAATIKSAKLLVDELRPEVWDILQEVVYQHPVLLNRPPTLHRLGIQAFECILVESSAIQLHPLVCFAFNADFDGDQMSVHIPLSVEAQTEARMLMMVSNNMISPANGKAVVAPKKDMVLGLYYLTMSTPKLKGEGLVVNAENIEILLNDKIIDLQANIKVNIVCKVKGQVLVSTTAGRVILYNNLPIDHKIAFEDINKLFLSDDSSKLFELVYNTCKRNNAVEFADKLMSLGFKYATSAAVSFSIHDLIDLKIKKKTVKETEDLVNEYYRQYLDGLITETERKHQVMEAWSKCSDILGKEVDKTISALDKNGKHNPLYLMYHSGARGTAAQMRQLMGMRGFVAKTSGEMIEHAIVPNYQEGLDPHNYFHTTNGTRKGFADMALKTADAGYFTRKLVDSAQDCIVVNKDCWLDSDNKYNQPTCITYEPIISMQGISYSDIFGRVLAQDVVNENNEILFTKNHMLTQKDIKVLENNYVLSVKIRSPITCLNTFGVCSNCYGIDLSKGKMACIGEPVGVIAAQSIGEPAAQLTMRTFHSGGGAKRGSQHFSVQAVCDGKIVFNNIKLVKKEDKLVTMSRQAEGKIVDDAGRTRLQFKIPYAASVFFNNNEKVKKGEVIAEWDNALIVKLANIEGFVRYVDLIENVSLRTVVDEVTGINSRTICVWKNSKKKNLEPSIMFEDETGKIILDENGRPIVYKLEVDDLLMVDDKAKVSVGDILIRKYKLLMKSSDITASLPDLVELFEARTSKIQAVLSEVNGTVTLGKDYRAKKSIIIQPLDNSDPKEYFIPKGINILVQSGDLVKKGDLLSEGEVSLHDILNILGVEKLVTYLLNNIKGIFKEQAMSVDNKHIECIIRYMLKKVQIVDSLGTKFIKDQEMDFAEFMEEVNKEGKIPLFRPILQGISKSASMDRSFLKSAAFQEPHRAIIKAILSDNEQNYDQMRGMKEALMTGKLIPAGTGLVMKNWNNK